MRIMVTGGAGFIGSNLSARLLAAGNEVIVVDNASSDGSVEAVKDRFPQVELIENETNLGFAAGNNVGVKYAKSPVILFLNPDTVIKDHAIQKSLEVLL